MKPKTLILCAAIVTLATGAYIFGQGFSLRDPAFVAALHVAQEAAEGYTAYATTFSDTNDIRRGADLTSNADGLVGAISMWVKFNGGDGSLTRLLVVQGPMVEVYKQADNTMAFAAVGTDADTKVVIQQDAAKVNPLTNGSGWTWIAFSWDNNSGGSAKQIYINGTEALEAGGSYDQDDVNIDYTRSDHCVGANFGGNTLDGCLMEVWANYTNYVDWSSSANRDKFYNAGQPVDLGSDGTTPGFGQPVIYLKDPYTSFTNNAGYGGVYEDITGELSECTPP